MTNDRDLPWKTEKEFYDMHAEKFFQKDATYHVGGVGKSGSESIEHIVRKLRLKPDSKVLDLGCGSGFLVNRISEVCSAVGISTSEECIRLAKKNYPDAIFLQADMESFQCQAITHCVAIESMGYANIERVFRRVHQNLVVGGVFFIKELCLLHNLDERQMENVRYWEDYWKYSSYDVLGWINSAYRNGFDLIGFESISHSSSLNVSIFMETLKNNAAPQVWPYEDVLVHTLSEFTFKKRKQPG